MVITKWIWHLWLFSPRIFNVYLISHTDAVSYASAKQALPIRLMSFILTFQQSHEFKQIQNMVF